MHGDFQDGGYRQHSLIWMSSAVTRQIVRGRAVHCIAACSTRPRSVLHVVRRFKRSNPLQAVRSMRNSLAVGPSRAVCNAAEVKRGQMQEASLGAIKTLRGMLTLMIR